ncbi:MAG: dihydroxyacetone kinase subunit DhaL [Mycobacteriaceae bacterium]
MIDAADVFRTFTASVEGSHEQLTRLDQLSGDGDFGENLRSGLAQVLGRLDHGVGVGGNGFLIGAEVFLDNVGGTSGPLFGLLFQSVGAAWGDRDLTVESLSAGVSAGLAAIQRVGEAQVGDRTLVDALAPAADALAAGRSIHAAAEAALDGARATSQLRGRMGRASYVGERVIGHPDPGAVGIALLMHAFASADDAEGVRLLSFAYLLADSGQESGQG